MINHHNKSSQIGERLDHFLLEEEIGRGGFGVVYRASQTKPIQREVALKILKSGMDSGEIMTRFEGERQALAMMDHSGIAKVFDAGISSSGAPYFVMELVHGYSITRFCNDHQLDTSERLELMCQVCSAVQHAHQRGIIHRDLKPSNILVSRGKDDEEAQVKIIDFGIAKAIEEKFTQETLVTALGQMLGTPQYMSPEQAGGMDQDIDTRSDIYSLGVILYELLTGSPPLDAEALRSASFSEMHHMICEEIPPRPSARIASALTTLDELATQKELRKRRSQLANDLDWVILKALEKDRERRYVSAASLAEDLTRYLSDEPVLASPPSRIYKIRKFVKRNPASTIAAAIILGGLIVTLGALTRERTAIAERNTALSKKNALLMESRLNMANMASQKGDWEKTIRVIDEALTFENADSMQLRLDKLRALVAVNRVAEARDLLTQILEEKDTNPKHLGLLTLWKAEFAMIQDGAKNSKQLMKQAINYGLASENQHYAEGLLARKSLEKIEHFKKALKVSPFHHSANVRMTMTLILLGRFEEAEKQLHFIKAAFPQDPSSDIMQAIIYSFRGEEERAIELMEARSIDENHDLEIANMIVDGISSFGKIARDRWDLGGATSMNANVLKSMKVASRLRSFQGGKERSEGSLYLFDAAELEDSLGALIAASKDISLMKLPMLNSGKRAVSRLQKAAENHPECFMHFMCGITAISYADRSKKPSYYNHLACKSFEQAIKLPSLIPDLQKEAMYALGMSYAILFVGDMEDEGFRKKMIDAFRKRLEMGKPFKKHQLELMYNCSKNSKETSMCRSILELQLEMSPDNHELSNKLAEIENMSGNFAKSLNLARKAMLIETDDAEKTSLQKLIDKNLDRIRELENE